MFNMGSQTLGNSERVGGYWILGEGSWKWRLVSTAGAPREVFKDCLMRTCKRSKVLCKQIRTMVPKVSNYCDRDLVCRYGL